MWSFFSRDSAKDFPYEIGEPVAQFDSRSIWSLHRGKRKGSAAAAAGVDAEVSVFVYDIRNGTDVKLELAKAAVKRLKTLRHPSILQFLDSLETDKVLYVATEQVEPLGAHSLGAEGHQRELYLAWGIFQITVSTKERGQGGGRTPPLLKQGERGCTHELWGGVCALYIAPAPIATHQPDAPLHFPVDILPVNGKGKHM